MKKILILIFVLQVQTLLVAQTQEKITTYFTMYQVDLWVKGTTKFVSGVLFSINDSTLTVSYSTKKHDYAEGTYSTKVYRLDDIFEVKSHRIYGGGIGFFVGLVGSGVIGGLVGKSKDKRYFYSGRPRRMVKYGVIGGLLGGNLGLIIGRKGIRGVPAPQSKLMRKLKTRAIKR